MKDHPLFGGKPAAHHPATRLARLLALGTRGYSSKDARRLKVVNGMAYLIVFFSALYAATYAIADMEKYRWFVITNAALVVMGLCVPFLHRFHEIAGGLAIALCEPLALFLFAAMLGRSSGIGLNLIIGAAAPFFIFGVRRVVLGSFVVLLSFGLHIAAWFLFPPHKALIAADTRLIDQLYLSSALTTFGIIAMLVWYALRLAEKAEGATESLLRNILPATVVDRLMERPGEPLADSFEEVTVLFTDLAGFVTISKALGATRTVAMLNELVSAFDALAARHGVEKIKTIGDAYMAVAGVPDPASDHAARMARFAMSMGEAVDGVARRFGAPLALRIGVASGPVMAGVIGRQKFSYDVWGDAVNLAARLEQSGVPGRIHVSAGFRRALGEEFETALRGSIDLKGFERQETYFLAGPVPVPVPMGGNGEVKASP